MARSIGDEAVERLIEELAAITGEGPSEVVRTALAERLAHLEQRRRLENLWRYLETEVWPDLPSGERGRVLTHEERDSILGYGSDRE